MVIDADIKESQEDIFINYGKDKPDIKRELDKIINVELIISEMVIPYGDESVW